MYIGIFKAISGDKKPNELLLLLCRIKIVFSANENFYAPKEINTEIASTNQIYIYISVYISGYMGM